MPIIIKKRVLKKKPAPDALVEPRPQKPAAKAPPPATERTPFEKLPVAASVEELFASGGKMRAPAPTTCKLCGHLYGFPCHGEKATCMNAKWARARGKEVAA
ncbi:hypothetical protein [Nitratireductor sp. OM-1]|uniref:hypothetical protein n=1 Tax=Nitratireductor sp. OM-1 TaxID=1756988 RepID=UPI000DE0423C|nr:hypothetical protein [Nitratireductor sp. OM-1]